MSQYTLGNVEVTNGSPTVTGVEDDDGNLPSWSGNVDAGDLIRVGTDVVYYQIASVVSGNELTLSSNYGGTPESGGSDYEIIRDFTANRGYPKPNQGDIHFADLVARAFDEIDTDMVSLIDSGVVGGPASSTDNAIARFDGTDGKSVQNSTSTIDDNGNMTVNGDLRVDGGNIGITGDTDLAQFAVDEITVNGNVIATGDLTIDDITLDSPNTGRLRVTATGFPTLDVRRSDNSGQGGIYFGGSSNVNSIWRNATGETVLGDSSFDGWLLLTSTEVTWGADAVVGFSSSNNANSGTPDTTLSRAAAGKLKIDQAIVPTVDLLEITGAATTIPSDNNVVRITNDGAYTLNTTPTIATAEDGQEILLINQSAATITLQDESNLAGSKINSKSGADISLTTNIPVKLIYLATPDAWYEI